MFSREMVFFIIFKLFKLNKYSTVLISGFIKSRRDLISLLAGALLFVLMLAINPLKFHTRQILFFPLRC
jgi:hypothetical protein